MYFSATLIRIIITHVSFRKYSTEFIYPMANYMAFLLYSIVWENYCQKYLYLGFKT